MKILVHIIILLGGLLHFQPESLAQEGIVPPIRNVGVTPVRWIGDQSSMSQLSDFRKLTVSSFSGLVRQAKRFQIINDQIVKNNWNSPGGRQSMVDQFELNGYLAMTVDDQEDLLVVTVRLYDPSLRTYLKESERIKKTWIYKTNSIDHKLRIKKLVFRLLNRYPIDVFVTSVQGAYVTISGGKNQNLFEGDELTFYNVSIAQTHPLDGSWLSYQHQLLGKAKVIESKSFSAIARLTSLSYEGAIKNGAAAKIRHISSRKLFAEKKGQGVKTATAANEPTIVQLKKPLPQPVLGPQVNVPIPPQKKKQTTKIVEKATEPESEPEELGPSFLDKTRDFLKKYVKTFHAIAGLRLWDASGTSSTKASFPFWVANHFEAWGDIHLQENHRARLGTHIGLGPTSDGSFFSLGLSGTYTIKVPQPGLIFQSIDGLEYGALAELGTTQASGSSYGGHDTLTLGGLIRAYGRHHFVDSSQTIDGEATLKLRLLSFGQAGLAGTAVSISGVLGYELETLALLKKQTGQWEWGGLFRYESNDFSVSSGSLSLNSVFLGGTARIRF